MARWKHAWEVGGAISFQNGKQADIVDGEFDAPDDPALEARFEELGHRRIPLPPKVPLAHAGGPDPKAEERAPPPEDDEQGEGGEPAEAPKPDAKPKSKGRKKAEERAPPPPPEA